MKQEKSRELKLKMAQIRVQFPINNYSSIYQYEFGIQDEKSLARIRQVWSGFIADEEIINNFEFLLDKINY